jgi:predicted dehydrogenase
VPFQKNRFHYTWHWWYDFGTGDMGNDGVHEIDIARWGLGVETHPSYVSAAGGKYFFKDDQQFPDTQYVSFEYPSNGRTRQLVFEQRLWSPYGFDRIDNGNAFYGTKGWMLLSKRGVLKVFNERHEPVEIDTNVSGESHQANFIAAVRGEQPVNAPIDVGHLSASLCHLGNIATRLGRSLRFEPTSERFIGDDEANTRVGRIYRDDHWGTPKQT